MLGSRSVGRWFRVCTLVEVYFVILIPFFSILKIQKKQNFIARSSHSNLKPFLKIYEYYNFKQNKGRAYWNFIKYLFYKKLLQTFRKSISLVKGFFLVNLFIGGF